MRKTYEEHCDVCPEEHRKTRTRKVTVADRLSALRACMKQEGIDAYLVPTDDFHGSEYVGDYFKCRAFLTGFTGSAGTALVLADSAYLWTDGRYFLQAAQQLEGTGITLMKAGQEGVPGIEAFLAEHLSKGQVLGYDGRCVAYAKADQLRKKLEAKGISCSGSTSEGPLDLAGRIWEDRPPLSAERVWQLDDSYTGKSRAQKLAMVREAMEKENCSWHILSSLDDIAWLLNLRGSDIEDNPVFLSYLMVMPQKAYLYAAGKAFDASVRGSLEQDGVELRPYEEIYADAKKIPAKDRILLDPSKVSDTLWTSVKHAACVKRTNPEILMKAVKNPVEMAHIRQAHIKDGVSVCRLIFWLKEQMKHADQAEPVTELGVAQKLLALRQEQAHFLGPSFETIAAYGTHGAVIHYSPTPESDIPVEPRGFLLLDSGGQYLEGTTDITRTFAMGPVSDKMKRDFTRIVRSNLALANAVFLYGCTGMNLDVLARMPLWEDCLDYKHGTGHGVGHVLNVHEGPNGFRWRQSPDRSEGSVLEEGMITTDEPGIYLEGEYGIRLENELICRRGVKNEYGQFMYFEVITWVPFDLDAVLPEELSPAEKRWLNAYHAEVYRRVSPYLSADETEWLRHATRAV